MSDKLPADLWNAICEPFDEKIPRRTAIAVKHDKWGLAFAYPSDFGKIGYLLDTEFVTGYKENPAISLSFAEYSSRDVPHRDLEKNTFFFRDMNYRPALVNRKIEFSNMGIRADEIFCQAVDGGFVWDVCCEYLNHPNTPLKRKIFTVLTVSDDECVTKVSEGLVEIEYRSSEIGKIFICSNFENAAAFSSIDNFLRRASTGSLDGGDGNGRYVVFQHDLDSTREKKIHIRFGMHLHSSDGAREAYTREIPTDALAEQWNSWFHLLPPLKTQNADEIKAYYKCWSVVRTNYYKHPQLGSTIVEALPVYRGYWQWGLTAMETVSACDPELGPVFFKSLVDIFLDHQREDGFVTHAIYLDEKTPGEGWSRTNYVQTPHIPWLVMRYYEKTGNLDGLKRWYGPLRRYYDYLCDSRDNGFKKLHLWAVLSSFDTGLDTTPPLERVTYGEDGVKESFCYPAIFSAERAKYEDAMSKMAGALENGDEKHWLEQSKITIAAMNDHLWDAEKNWFGVIHEDGSLDTRVGVDGLFPLAYGLIETDRAILARENFIRLLGPYGVRTTAEGEKGYYQHTYWRGPVWPKSLSVAGEAAVNYYPDLVESIRESAVRFALRHPSIWECMDADMGEIGRGDAGMLATPVVSSNVGAGELIGLFRLLRGEVGGSALFSHGVFV